MQVKSIAECSPLEHSAILSTFIKLPFVIKIIVLSIFEWPFYKGFTVVIFDPSTLCSLDNHTLGNRKDPVDMPQNVALHQALH